MDVAALATPGPFVRLMAEMSRRPVVIAIVAILAALLLAPIVLLALAGPAGDAEAPPNPTSSGQHAVAPAALDPRAMLWSFAQPHFPNGVPGQAYSLQAGNLADDAPIIDLEVQWMIRGEDPGRLPAIARPAGGAVAFVADDGQRSHLRRVAIRPDANPELVAELEPIVWDLVVDPAGTTAYLAVLHRDGTDAGVLAVPLDGSGPPRPLMPPAVFARSPDDGIRLAAVLPFGAQLDMSLDGQYLARRICTEDQCRDDLMELATGAIMDIGQWEPIGIVGHMLVHSRCDLPRCTAVGVDLRTGAEREIGPVERQAILLSDGAGPVLVVEADLQQDGRALAVNAIALGSGAATEVARAPVGGELSLIATHAFDSVLLSVAPSIAFVDVGAGNGHRLAIDVITGESLEVRVPPIRHAPGGVPQG